MPLQFTPPPQPQLVTILLVSCSFPTIKLTVPNTLRSGVLWEYVRDLAGVPVHSLLRLMVPQVNFYEDFFFLPHSQLRFLLPSLLRPPCSHSGLVATLLALRRARMPTDLVNSILDATKHCVSLSYGFMLRPLTRSDLCCLPFAFCPKGLGEVICPSVAAFTTALVATAGATAAVIAATPRPPPLPPGPSLRRAARIALIGPFTVAAAIAAAAAARSPSKPD